MHEILHRHGCKTYLVCNGIDLTHSVTLNLGIPAWRVYAIFQHADADAEVDASQDPRPELDRFMARILRYSAGGHIRTYTKISEVPGILPIEHHVHWSRSARYGYDARQYPVSNILVFHVRPYTCPRTRLDPERKDGLFLAVTREPLGLTNWGKLSGAIRGTRYFWRLGWEGEKEKRKEGEAHSLSSSRDINRGSRSTVNNREGQGVGLCRGTPGPESSESDLGGTIEFQMSLG
ncbi:hypothetical protein BDV19DRAFT_392844 [Aspergillus venezuelensis]